MLSNLILVMVIAQFVLLALCIKHIRLLRRDVDTLFRLRSEEVAPAALPDPKDAAAHAVDRHVSEFHRRA